MPLMATLAAVSLGAYQVARERHAKTLDYLRVLPVDAGTIVWAKFVAGTTILLLLVGALVWLGYSDPTYHADVFTSLITANVDRWKLATFVFSRFWCVYAFALFLSVLVDRAATAVVGISVCVIVLVGLQSACVDSTPLADVEPWLPFWQSSIGLFSVPRDPALLWRTSVSLCPVTVFFVISGAASLKRSSEPFLSKRVLALGAAGLIGLAILAGEISGAWLPRLAPAGSLEIQTASEMESGNDLVDMAAAQGLVCLGLNDRLIFLDFSDPERPRKTAEVQIAPWTTTSVSFVGTEAYVVGERKAIPKNEIGIFVAKLQGQDAVQISAPTLIGTVDRDSGPVPRLSSVQEAVSYGRFAYGSAGCSINQPQCRLQVFDLTTRRETAALLIETFRPNPRRPEYYGEPFAVLATLLRGTHLYVTSPSALTTLDVGNPAQPVISSRIDFVELVPLLYGVPRPMFSVGERLYVQSLFPPSLHTYDLSDPSRPVHTVDVVENFADSPVDGNWVVSEPAFYQRWGHGVVEIRATSRGLETVRYLDNGRGARHGVERLAAGGEYVYEASYNAARKTERVDAFRVRE
jgi:hypothetical protein